MVKVVTSCYFLYVATGSGTLQHTSCSVHHKGPITRDHCRFSGLYLKIQSTPYYILSTHTFIFGNRFSQCSDTIPNLSSALRMRHPVIQGHALSYRVLPKMPAWNILVTCLWQEFSHNFEPANRSIEKKVLTMCILKAVYISVEYNLSDLSMQLLDIIHVWQCFLRYLTARGVIS